MMVLLAVAVLVLAVVLGTVWGSRDRAARRLNAALEVYAQRELARPRRRESPHPNQR
jgi:hypothetical protein